MKRLLSKLRLSYHELAQMLNVPKASVQNWAEGVVKVPTRYKPYIQALENYEANLLPH